MGLDRLLNYSRAANRPPVLYPRPIGLFAGPSAIGAIDAGIAQALGDTGLAFGFVEILWREQDDVIASAILSTTNFSEWLDRACPNDSRDHLAQRYARLIRPTMPWAGFDLTRPVIMGIVNVTPDSFSDGGDHADPESAIRHGLALRAAGADILDIGGESTRPGATPVTPEVELSRVTPVIRALAAHGATISIDSRHTQVMEAALDAGAKIINDVFALQAPGALALATARKAPVVLMHMRGEPRTMQVGPLSLNTLDIWDFLDSRLTALETAGGARSQAMVDPGIGFGKTGIQNLEILRNLGLFRTTGSEILLGVSRKRLIEQYGGVPAAPKERLPGSLALALDAVTEGARVLRVHDVAETRQALRLWQASRQAE